MSIGETCCQVKGDGLTLIGDGVEVLSESRHGGVGVPEGSLRVGPLLPRPRVTLLDTLPTLVLVLCPFNAGILTGHHDHLLISDHQDLITHKGVSYRVAPGVVVGVLLSKDSHLWCV